MPKVLRIINRFNLGGPTYNVAYLTKYLSPEFQTLLVGGAIDSAEKGSDHILKELGIEPILIPSMKRRINPVDDYFSFRQLKKIIKEFKPDIVHTHASKAGTIGRLAAISCKVPVVIHTFHGHVFHSYFGSWQTSAIKLIERELAKRSTAIVAISEKQKEELSRIHHIAKTEKIKVIPLGFDLDRFQNRQIEKRQSFRTTYQITGDEIAIGIIGRLVPVKNHNLFLDAIAYVVKNSSQKVKAFIIGDGEERQNILNRIENLQLNTVVTLTSWITEVDWAMAGMDIVCLSSFNEGTPVSLIEAQAANKAIVSTAVGGIENTVIRGSTALLSEVNDQKAYFDNLLSLVESKSIREFLASSGWNFVRDKFHYNRLVNDTRLLYREMLM